MRTRMLGYLLGQEMLILNDQSSGHKGDEGGHQAFASLPHGDHLQGGSAKSRGDKLVLSADLLVLKGTFKGKAIQK